MWTWVVRDPLSSPSVITLRKSAAAAAGRGGGRGRAVLRMDACGPSVPVALMRGRSAASAAVAERLRSALHCARAKQNLQSWGLRALQCSRFQPLPPSPTPVKDSPTDRIPCGKRAESGILPGHKVTNASLAQWLERETFTAQNSLPSQGCGFDPRVRLSFIFRSEQLGLSFIFVQNNLALPFCLVP